MAVDHSYIEVSCQRTVAGTSFPAGVQDYVFSVGRPNVFLPDKSYMRFELAVTGIGGVAPTVASQIASSHGANMIVL